MNKNVMLIEDSEDTLHILSYFLEREHYSVMKAQNGQEALELLRSSTALPAVIFLDISMPVMDGQQFREAQQIDPRIAPIPVVLMSAGTHIENEANDLHIDAFLKKPFDAKDLIKTAEQYCH